MPSSARKSSLGAGARRGLQKAHIPYRGDNPEVGRKTGIAIQHVERGSDGYESFNEVLQQAVGKTPPNRRKSYAHVQEHRTTDDFDENGELSMDVESPLQYLANSRPARTPVLSRVGSSSRHSRLSDIDYTHIPSPKARKSAARKSFTNGARDALDSDPLDDDMGAGGGMDNDDFDDLDDRGSPSQRSFVDIDRDDEDDELPPSDEELPAPPSSPAKVPTPRKSREPSSVKSKGKSRATEEEMEEDISRALDDVDMDPLHSDEERQDVEDAPKAKKVKVTEPKPSKPKVVRESRKKKENIAIEGVRRSQREPIRPLEWWRLEKVVYGRPTDNRKVMVPHIKEIVRIPTDLAEPLSKKRKRVGRSKSKSVAPQEVVVYDPEEGWDGQTREKGVVMDFDTQKEVERRIAFTKSHINPLPAANGEWLFEKIFGDGDFIAAGQLVIPPRGRKPSKATKDNTYIFYIIEGAVTLKIHETSMVLCTGATFMVPRGNTYYIENITDRESKLFFTQARKVVEGAGTPSRTPMRSSSVGGNRANSTRP